MNKIQRLFALLFIFATAVLFFWSAFDFARNAAVQDMGSLWSAAKLLEENPYSPQLVRNLELSAGYSRTLPPLILRNPPWSLFFFLPLRFFSYPAAFALWASFNFVCLAACARLCWKAFTPEPSLAPALLSLLFGPSAIVLLLGQTSVLVLLGVTLFLVAVQHDHDLCAGTAMLLLFVKPHLVFIFLAVAFFWAIYLRKWGFQLGAIGALAASSLLAVTINPHIFRYYGELLSLVAAERVPHPSLSGLLFLISNRESIALIPVLVGLLWGVWYWWVRRDSWDWNSHGMLVLLVSLVCTSYSYSYDEVVAIPPLLAAYATGNRARFLSPFVVINFVFLLYLLNSVSFNFMFLSWTATGWLLTFLLTRTGFSQKKIETDSLSQRKSPDHAI